MALATFQGLYSHMWLVATVSGSVGTRKFHRAALQLSPDQPPPPEEMASLAIGLTLFPAELIDVYGVLSLCEVLFMCLA